MMTEIAYCTLFVEDKDPVVLIDLKIFRLDSNYVYHFEPLENKNPAKYSLEQYYAKLKANKQECIEESEKNARIEDEHLKKRRVRRDKLSTKLAKYGKWKNRFNWILDTIKTDSVIFKGLNAWEMNLRKMGIVKKMKEDTLIIERNYILVDTNSCLEVLNDFMSTALPGIHFYNYLTQLFMTYFISPKMEAGFLLTDDWIDSTVIDFVNIEKEIAVCSVLKIKINDRYRSPQLFRISTIKLAEEYYTVKDWVIPNCLLFDSTSLEYIKETSIPDSLFTLQGCLNFILDE